MVTILEASYAEQQALQDVLSPSFSACIHSVYEHVINICNHHDNKMYCLTSDSMDNAPATIKLYLPYKFDFRQVAAVGDAVMFTIEDRFDSSTPLVVHMKNAKSWICKLPVFPDKDIVTLVRNMEVLRRTIAVYGKTASGIFADVLEQRVIALMDALNSNDFAQAINNGLKLLGLGCGQTPAGDDFLCGLITVFNMEQAPFDAEFRQFGHRIAAESVQKTTMISKLMLHNAALGLARAHVINLLEGLTQDLPPEQIEESAKKVIRIGSSSGTDLAVGLVAGVELGLRRLTTSHKGG